MKKIFILFLTIIPITAKADCSNQNLTKYKNLASNIESYYTFNEDTKKMDVTIYNLSNELELKNGREEYSTNDSPIGKTTIYGLSPGETLKLTVYKKNGECESKSLRTIYVNLPNYNQYYNSEICINNNHQLCSKWVNTSVYTYDQFVKKVESETKNNEEEQTPEEEMKKYGIADFLLDYYMVILLAIIVIGIPIIYRTNKKRKFDF